MAVLVVDALVLLLDLAIIDRIEAIVVTAALSGDRIDWQRLAGTATGVGVVPQSPDSPVRSLPAPSALGDLVLRSSQPEATSES